MLKKLTHGIKATTRLAAVLLMLLLITHSYSSAQESSTHSYKVLFLNNSDSINRTILSNNRSLEELDSTLQRISQSKSLSIDSILILCGSSPEGTPSNNAILALSRAEAVKNYTKNSTSLSDTLFIIDSPNNSWQALKELVIANPSTPYQQQIIQIIDSIPLETWTRVNPSDRWLTLTDSRMKQLLDLKGGRAYNYLKANLFPQLRYASLDIHYRRNNRAGEISPNRDLRGDLPVQYAYTISRLNPKSPPTSNSGCLNPVFAIKSNLLFDAMSLINLEIEVPIGRKWSIATEVIFPWWTFDNGKADSKRNRLQLFSANLEARYWWNNKPNSPILTGWFTGVYGGGGLYDFEYHARGYQGEFFIAFGVSGGYLHTINKSKTLRLEYSIGIGHLETNYRYYEAIFCNNEYWHAIRQRTGRYSWLGPTKLKVSLSWLINCKKRAL